MPALTTVYQWRHAHPEFAAAYAIAREDQADTLAADIVRIADTEPDANRARVMVDARKWIAAKLKPRHYSDRVEVAGDAAAPLTVQIVRMSGDDGTSSGGGDQQQ